MNEEEPDMVVLCDRPPIEITPSALAWLMPFLQQVEKELGEPTVLILTWGETWVFPAGAETMPAEASALEERWEELVSAPGVEHAWRITVGCDPLSRIDEDRRERIKRIDGMPILLETSTFQDITPASGLTLYLDEANNRLDHRPRAGELE